MSKKLIRAKFRQSVFDRDGHQCVKCGSTNELDAHHIVNRNEMPDGGYITENGITLCGECHWKAEQFHKTGVSVEEFARRITGCSAVWLAHLLWEHIFWVFQQEVRTTFPYRPYGKETQMQILWQKKTIGQFPLRWCCKWQGVSKA